MKTLRPMAATIAALSMINADPLVAPAHFKPRVRKPSGKKRKNTAQRKARKVTRRGTK